MLLRFKRCVFSIQQGEWVAIIGHNGSGKSTLAKTINGLLLPAAGTIKVGGKELNEANVWDIRRMVGMVFRIQITNLSVQQSKTMWLLV